MHVTAIVLAFVPIYPCSAGPGRFRASQNCFGQGKGRPIRLYQCCPDLRKRGTL